MAKKIVPNKQKPAAKKPTKAKPITKAKAKPKSTAKPKSKPTPTAAKPKSKPSPKPTPKLSAGPDKVRDSQAAISRAKSSKAREIGEIPDISDIERRERCAKSLKLFCETYNPTAFYYGWSDDHLRVIARIEEAATQGSLFAVAMARGSGKTTICRMAALWAVAYQLCRYVFVIGATDAKACEALDTIRVFVRFLPEFSADFPEISYPAQRLSGIANRATGQTCRDVSTLIEWSADQIVFATVPPPANWPKHWPLRDDGMVPSSGTVVSASGLTGEGIRGSLKTLMTGEMVRPDLVLLDDPQTPGSARSNIQNINRLKLISADVLGMAGPGQSIAAVMPCTVIERGDMIDQVLDRSKHPMWRGERSGILKSMPTNMDAWEEYFDVYSTCAQFEPPDFTDANEYYIEHREKLDAGAKASWEDRKDAAEVSAIQSAMHLYFRDRRGFMAEYMNEPVAESAVSLSALTADEVIAKGSNLPRLVVPRTSTILTAMIDVGAHVLWYAICAWDEKFGGAVIDHGSYPDQRRDYFTAADARLTLGDCPGMGGQSQDAAIYAGLTAIAAHVLGRAYTIEDDTAGHTLKVERCLVDANWGPGTDLVYEFCRRSSYAGTLIPSHGKFIGASSNPMGSWPARPGEKKGTCWRISASAGGRGRHVTFDANWWKTFAADRLRTPEGGAGCLRLFHAPTGGHKMIADHITAEYPVPVTGKGRTVEEWKEKPGRDNHWLDCLVGSMVAASIAGAKWSAAAASGVPIAGPKPKQRITLEEAQRQAAERKPL